MPDGVHWLDDLEMRAWRGLLTVHSRMLAQLDLELQATQMLSLADYAVLVTLSEASDHRLRMSDLADRILVSPSGLTRRVDALVRQGMVRREPCPDDRRGTFAVLTESGLHRLEDAAPYHVAQVRQHFFDQLDRQQLKELADTLEMIQRPLDERRNRSAGREPASISFEHST